MSTNQESRVKSLSGAVTFGSLQIHGNLEEILVDLIRVEDSPTRKYLRLKIGDLHCNQSVFIEIDGEEYEITMDALPDK